MSMRMITREGKGDTGKRTAGARDPGGRAPWPGRGEFLHNDGREAKQRHGRRQEGKRGEQELLEANEAMSGRGRGRG